MISSRPLSEDDLQGYIDRRLDDARRAAVETYLATDEQTARRVAEEIADRDALRARLAGIALEPIPARLRIAHIHATRRAAVSQHVRAAAALIACVVIGSVGGWFASERFHSTTAPAAELSVADDAIVAWKTYTVEVAHPVEVSADHEAHLVQWLSRRLGQRLTAPKLDALGLKLIGGRLLPATNAPAAQFMYEDAQGRRVTIYVRPGGANEPSSFRFEHSGDVAAFSWIDAKLSYAVVAQADRGNLLDIARAIYEQYEALGSG
jgi:anti-sigma factor RsiW